MQVYEYALRSKNEEMAVKRPDDMIGYDKQLDDLYQEVEPQTDGSHLTIRRIG